VRTFRSRVLCRAAGNGAVRMNPFDAGPLGIGDGDAALVRSPAGALRVRVRTGDRVPRGIVVAESSAEFSTAGLCRMEAQDPERAAPQTHCIAVTVEADHGNE